MGQKVNPHGLRVGIIKDWDSRWFADKKHFGDTLVEDYNLRRDLKKQLFAAGVPKIEIERDGKKVRIHIHCAKPGMIIGKGGAEIEKLRQQCEKKLGKPVAINIVEVKNPDLNAQLVAESIAAQLERRISFRIPLQTLRADIDYGFAEANTTYGKIGVKVWLYRGEVLRDNAGSEQRRERRERRDRRDRRPRRDNREGGRK